MPRVLNTGPVSSAYIIGVGMARMAEGITRMSSNFARNELP